MSRPNSVLGLFRRLVVARWKKLSLNTRLALVAGGLVMIAAAVSGALGLSLCPASGGCCMRGQAAEAVEAHPVITPVDTEATEATEAAAAEAHGDCPYSSQP